MTSKALTTRDREVLIDAGKSLLQRRVWALQAAFPYADAAGRELLQQAVLPPDTLALLRAAYAVAPEMVQTTDDLRFVLERRVPVPEQAKPLRLKVTHRQVTHPYFFYTSRLHYGAVSPLLPEADRQLVEDLTVFANDLWRVQQENTEAAQHLRAVVHACSTSGQVMEFWPLLLQLAKTDRPLRDKLNEGRDTKRVNRRAILARLHIDTIQAVGKIEDLLAMAYMLPDRASETVLLVPFIDG